MVNFLKRIAAASLLVLPLISCSDRNDDQPAPKRYEMLIILEGPAGRLLGMSRFETRRITGSSLDSHDYHYDQISGSGAAIRQKNGKFLYATINAIDGTMPIYWDSSTPLWNENDEISLDSGSWVPFREEMKPIIIGFKDEKSWYSVYIASGLGNHYGPKGYERYRAFIRISERNPVNQVSGKLTWLQESSHQSFRGGQCSTKDVVNCINGSWLVRGM